MKEVDVLTRSRVPGSPGDKTQVLDSFGLREGSLVLIAHDGSAKAGVEVFMRYHEAITLEAIREGYFTPDEALSGMAGIPLCSSLGQECFRAVKAMENYAYARRVVALHLAVEALREVCGEPPQLRVLSDRLDAVGSRSMDDFLAEFDTYVRIGHLLARPVRRLSLGERMRGELAAALLHDPDLLFLDEPTIGLDLSARDGLLRLLRRRIDRGCTVFLATHRIEDVEALSRRVILLSSGRLAFDGPAGELRERLGERRSARVTYRGELPAEDVAGLRVLRWDPEAGVIEVEVGADVPPSVVVGRLEKAVHVSEVTVGFPPLEHVVKAVFDVGERTEA